MSKPSQAGVSLPSLEEIKQFVTLTVIPILAGAGATWLMRHFQVLALVGQNQIAEAISSAASFLVTVTIAWLSAHHILRQTYTGRAGLLPGVWEGRTSTSYAVSPLNLEETRAPARPKRVYGWKRSLPGIAYPYADTGELMIAAEVDPRKKLPPIFDQGQLGSCTANATAACFQYDSILDGKDCGELSRLWIYYFERSLEHTLSQGDCGAMGHDAFTVAKHGIPDESKWPYDIGRFEAKPPASEPRAYTLSKQVRTVAQTEAAIKQVLSNSQTIAFGFTVYASFESDTVAKTGVVPMPKKGEEVLGGHEVLAVGYLKAHPGYILCRNSWGTEWGLGGYFLMPVKYLTSPDLAGDLRTIVRPV